MVEHSLWEEDCSVCHYHSKQATHLVNHWDSLQRYKVNLQEQECLPVVKWGRWPENGCAAELVTLLTTTDPMGIIIITGSTLDSPQHGQGAQ